MILKKTIAVIVAILMMLTIPIIMPNNKAGNTQQLPDPTGWDVAWQPYSVYPYYGYDQLADDFSCNQSGFVDGISFWISTYNDSLSQVEIMSYLNGTGMSITDAPGNDALWSLGNHTTNLVGPFYGDEGWMIPGGGYEEHNHLLYWRVDIGNISNPFLQIKGTTYWLSIQVPASNESAIGWKTSQNHSGNPAEWGTWVLDHHGGFGHWDWNELYDPINASQIDFAFCVKDDPMNGSGTAEDPYQITNADQLNETRNNLSAYYIVMNDIDLNDYGIRSWNNGTGFDPIMYFTGNFNGQNYTIRNLFMNRSNDSYQALFGYLSDYAVVENLGLTNVDVTGNAHVGALIGFEDDYDGSITNCYSTGRVTGTTHVGGLIGYSRFSQLISNCHSSADVTGTGSDFAHGYVGGLIGEDVGTVRTCYATGNATGYFWVGGLIGKKSAFSINDCYSSGNVSGTDYVGGLIGDGYSYMTNCNSTSDVSGASQNTGGLLGRWYDDSVSYCYATGDVITTSSDDGGLIGASFCPVSNCYATGHVTASSSPAGLIGFNAGGTVTDCYSNGLLSGSNQKGLIGYHSGGTVTDSYWDINTSGTATSGGGGEVGRTTAQMTYSYVGYNPPCTGMYEGWDLANYIGNTTSIWVHDKSLENAGYPLFRTDYINLTIYAPVVITNSATGMGMTNATLHGTLTDDGNETCTVWFEYGINTSYGNITSNKTKHTGETFSTDITSLNYSTLYHYRAVAQNSNGTSYGSDETFWTINVSSPTVTINNTMGIGTTTATLQGTLTNDGNEICTVWFEYGTNTSYGYTTSNQSENISGVSFEKNISGLIPGTLYHFRAKAMNIIGTNHSDDGTFLTKPEAPNSFVAIGNYSQINLTWAKGTGANSTYIERSNHIVETYITPVSGYYDSFNVHDGAFSKTYDGSWATGDGQSIRFECIAHVDGYLLWDLSTSTDIKGVKLEAMGDSSDSFHVTSVLTYNGTWHTVWTGTVTYGYPPTIHYINFSLAKGTTMVRINATTDYQPGALAGVFEVAMLADWRRGDSLEVYNGTGSAFNDLNMTINTDTYYYQAWSYAEWEGLHQWSDNYVLTNGTLDLLPNVTTNDATGIKTTNATLNGYLTDDGNQACNVSFEYGKTVLYSNTTGIQIIRKGESFDADITGLTPETVYHFRAVATNDYGTSYGEDKIFNTTMMVTPPLSLHGTVISSQQINLSWVKSMNSSSGAPLDLFYESFDNIDSWVQDPSISNWGLSNGHAGGSGNEMVLNWNPGRDAPLRLYSSPIDTTGYSDATLSFLDAVDNYDGGYTLAVEVSTDHSTWSTVYSYDGGSGSHGSMLHEIPLTTGDGLGSSTFYISITFASGNTFDLNYWYIDDVHLSVAGGSVQTIGTRIQYSTSGYPTSINDGINCYNDTGTSTLVTNLTAEIHYYFSAWAWKQGSWGWSENYTTWNGTTTPIPPSNISTVENTPLNVTLSWTKGKEEYRTIVKRDDVDIYNDTGTSFIDAVGSRGTTYNYKFYSYNETSNAYSNDIQLNYTTLDYPVVETTSASAIGETTATLNGHLIFSGSSSSIILRPTGDFEIQEAWNHITGAPTAWQAINDVIPDDWTSYITYNPSYTSLALFNFTPEPIGTIESVTLHTRSYAGGGVGVINFYIGNKTNPSDAWISGYLNRDSDWVYSSNTRFTTPSGLHWTWDDISNYAFGLYSNDGTGSYVTQYYLEVNYSIIPCNVSFEYGKTTSYGNMTDGQMAGSGQDINIAVNNLSIGSIYHYRAVAHNAFYSGYGSDAIFLTKPSEPANFTVVQGSSGTANLSWTVGAGEQSEQVIKTTYIERNTIESWSIGAGTFVADVTGTTYQDIVSPGTYYYQIWTHSYNASAEQYSDNYASANVSILTTPIVQTNDATNVEKTTATLNGYLDSSGYPVSIGGIVWNNGGFSGNAIFSQLDVSYPFVSHTADDFQLATTKDIARVHWWGATWNGPATNPLEFNIYFFADDGSGTQPTGAGTGDPSSTALATYNFPSVTGIDLGGGDPNYYEYEVTLPTPFTANAGIKYWISVQAVQTFPPICGMALTSGVQLHEPLSGFPEEGYPYWTDIGYPDTAFYLFANAPPAINSTTYFEYGQTTSYGSITANQNKTGGQDFNASISNLSVGTQYHYRAVASNTLFTGYGDDKTFFTKPSIPVDPTITPHGPVFINLSWTKGTGEEPYIYTYVESNSVPSWSRGDGTFVAEVGTSYYETHVLPNSTTYFQLWTHMINGSVQSWSDDYASTDITTGPAPMHVYVDDDYTPLTPNWLNTSFKDIQNATYGVGTGGYVTVYNGTYNTFAFDKPLHIDGLYRESTIINGTNTTSYYNMVDVEASSEISGFTIQNCRVGLNLGVPNVNISNCVFTHTLEAGLLARDQTTVSNCYFYDIHNFYGAFGYGNDITFINCNFTRIERSDLQALALDLEGGGYYHNNKVINCQFWENSYGLLLEGGIGAIVKDSIFSNNYCGMLCDGDTNCEIFQNNFSRNLYSLEMGYTNSNVIYHNNFRTSLNDFTASNANDTMYNTTLLQGNYWDDFDEPTEGAWDNNSDGIIDQPRIIPNENPDLYPLASPYPINVTTIGISVTPGFVDFGETQVTGFNRTTSHYFTLTNNGIECSVEIAVNNSEDWQYVNLSNKGHNSFSMDWSSDNWGTSNNIKVGGSLLKENLTRHGTVPFDLKLWMPNTVSSTTQQHWTIRFTAYVIW